MAFSDTQRQLLALLADGEFHSGTALATQVGLSRAAVWKQLQGFLALGIEVTALHGKGYRLEQPLNLLNAERIHAQLSPAVLAKGVQLEILEHCASTNQQLMLAAREGAASGTVCLAEYQTAGKGRRGRQWVSAFGQNILLSVLWRFESGTAAVGGLSLAVGVAVVRALAQLGIHGVGLKWPNDLLWQDKKLGGILIEVSGESAGPCSVVVGLGLNGRLSADLGEQIQQPWVDLYLLQGQRALERNALTATLLNNLLPMLADFEHTPLREYLAEWRTYDCLLHKPVQFLLHQQVLQGVVQGIDDEGLLLLQDAQGEVRAYASGEISFHLPA